jgi:hypothetical protein
MVESLVFEEEGEVLPQEGATVYRHLYGRKKNGGAEVAAADAADATGDPEPLPIDDLPPSLRRQQSAGYPKATELFGF